MKQARTFLLALIFAASGFIASAQTLQTLVSFANTNGAYPYTGLTLGTDGNFYGTTEEGGSSGDGTVFQVTTNGTLTTLVSFSGFTGNPYAGLTLGYDGNFYGTTVRGGGSNAGTVFKVMINGTLTTMVSFNVANGMSPYAGLTLGNDGNFYGTTSAGGLSGFSGHGTVFKVTTNGTLTTLVSFNEGNGANPNASLTLGTDGNFYGTTVDGGITNLNGGNGYGTLFKVTTNGTLTMLASFNSTNGANPYAGLMLGNDGNFYGTTSSGGSNGFGTVFQVTTNGTLTTLASFNSTNGANPYAGLTMGNDGNLYGTTYRGGDNGFGTVFQVTTNGVLTTLVSFSNSNGANPYSALSLGTDGKFYGTTTFGGNTNLNSGNGFGTVFYLLLSPLITVQPQNQTNNAGATVIFHINATSLNSESFQWQKNSTNLVDGGNLSGANTNTLTITGISDSDAASYSVIVSNSYGTATSANATLTVIDPPIITDQPLSRTNIAGSTTTFTVQVNGTDPAYQWFKGTLPISGAVLPTLTLTNVQDADMAGYAVVLTNLAGSVTSAPPAILTVIDPPIITSQPLSRTNNAGSTATFTVTANGTTPAYQWFKDSLPISGAVLPTLTLTNVQDTDMAGYTVVLTNLAGSATSAPPATLTVIDLPIITAQPTNLVVLTGTNVAFGISLTGSASYFCYQWQFNGTNILNATNSVYAIASVATNNAGFYSLIVTNLAGSATSSNAALSVVLSPASRTNGASSMATFTASAFSPELLYFQWQKNGTNLVNGGNISGATNSTLIVSSVSDSDAAIYNTVVNDATASATTSNAVLTVNDTLVFATQPQSQTNLIGSSVSFNATAYGVPPFIFQWYFNATPVGSPTSGTNYSSYTIMNVGTNQAGIYTVKVVNGSGNVTSSNAVLTVAVTPVITTQPLSRTNIANTTATFSVAATSVLPLSYQWQQNGTNLVNGGKFSGVTNSLLSITTVASNEVAIYSVIVTNLAGSVTSSNAALTVIYPPVITTQPLVQRLVLGSGVSFTASVSGTPPFNYQWRFNSGNIPNATNSIYSIQAATTNNTGNYSVVVTNSAGSVTSSNALLTVLVPPTMALQFLAGYPLLNLNGMLSNNFVVQYSTDLTTTNWIMLLSVSNLSSSPYQFLDPAGIVPPERFYRAVMQ